MDLYLPISGQQVVDTQPDLYLAEMGSLKLQIFVKNLVGGTITLDVATEDSKKTEQEKLFEKDGIPVDLQVVLGQQMEREKRVRDYGIEWGSNVNLVMRNNGGM